jgi:hypothetical protein
VQPHQKIGLRILPGKFMNFYDKLNGAIAQNQSLLFVGLDPNPEMLPERYSQKSHPNTIIVSTFKNKA